MKKIGIAIGFFLLSLALISCTKENNISPNEEYFSKSTHETAGTSIYFIAEMDAINWEATHYGAEYNLSTGQFIIHADQFGDDLQTGNQIVLRFTSANALNYIGNPDLQAEVNTVIGGDSGAIPYEIDESYNDHSFEISEFDTDNQVIEGQFSIRLKRKDIYDNTGYGKYVYLTNGSFRLNYGTN